MIRPLMVYSVARATRYFSEEVDRIAVLRYLQEGVLFSRATARMLARGAQRIARDDPNPEYTAVSPAMVLAILYAIRENSKRIVPYIAGEVDLYDERALPPIARRAESILPAARRGLEFSPPPLPPSSGKRSTEQWKS